MFFVVGLILHSLGENALSVMILMIRTYQFIFHLPLLTAIMPPNIMMLYKVVIPIFCFDLLEGTVEWDAQNVYKYTKITPFPG